MKERLYYILMNILEKLEQSINVERITDNEIDTLFGSASGTGTDAQDYVVEHGVDGIWYYEKWASGKATLFANLYEKVGTWTAWGSVYETALTRRAYPTNFFTEIPAVRVQPNGRGEIAIMSIECSATAELTQTCGMWANRPVATDPNKNVGYSIEVVGRWK